MARARTHFVQAHVDTRANSHTAVCPQAAISVRTMLMIGEKEKAVDNVEGREGQVRDDESFRAVGEGFGCRTWRFGSHSA